MEITKIASMIAYRIEAKTDGGFIAHPLDPAMGTIEGATRQEVQEKIQAKIGELLAQKLTAGLNSDKGGFGHALERATGMIEGRMPEEAQEKIQAKIGELLAQQLPASVNSGGVTVTVNRKVSFTTRDASGTVFTKRQPESGSFSIPATIIPSSSGGTMLRVIAALLGVAALLYYFFFIRG
jgi:hypothetical protein